MPGRFPYKLLAKYPHMKPEDIAVWERFIRAYPNLYVTCDYDVPCGQGAPQNPEHPENIQADGKILTQKKIDVIGYSNDATYIIEVKPIADARALGQILTYEKLYMADHPELTRVEKMIVCGEIERELDAIFTEHDIITEVI
jgi:hypothetical protein